MRALIGTQGRGARALLAALFGVLAAAILAPAAAQAVDNGLARTPYMGWNTYYGLGIQYNESDIRSATPASP